MVITEKPTDLDFFGRIFSNEGPEHGWYSVPEVLFTYNADSKEGWQKVASSSVPVTVWKKVLEVGTSGLMRWRAELDSFLTSRGLPRTTVEYHEFDDRTTELLVLKVDERTWENNVKPIQETFQERLTELMD